MTRFLRWLETKFAGPTNTVASDRMSDTVSADSVDVLITSDADVPHRSDTVGIGKEFSMPDIYADGDVVTEPDHKILGRPSIDVDESAGFNPYDTGVLQKK